MALIQGRRSQAREGPRHVVRARAGTTPNFDGALQRKSRLGEVVEAIEDVSLVRERHRHERVISTQGLGGEELGTTKIGKRLLWSVRLLEDERDVGDNLCNVRVLGTVRFLRQDQSSLE